jgi:sortase B
MAARNLKEEKTTRLYRILLVVFAVVLVILVGIIIRNWYVQKHAQNVLEDLVEVTSEPVVTETVATETEEDEIFARYGIEVPEKNLDWDALWEENEDIYAWIYIPGTDVDYPILQHPTDDNYYLEYNIDGSKGRPGCIFTQGSYNSTDFTDYNTVIYGHNMNNGTMFHTLHNFEDKTFFDEYQYAFIYMPDQVLVYNIFAAYTFTDDHLFYRYALDTEAGFQEFLDDAFDIRDMSAHFRDGVEVTTDNHIITLSTCIRYQPDDRYLVLGVLVNDPTITEDR